MTRKAQRIEESFSRAARYVAADSNKLSVPCIHLNGTSANSLCEEIRNAMDAIELARVALSNMTVHSRDHYVKADKDSFNKALVEHEARFVALDKIKDDLTEIYMGIQDQV